MEDQNKVPPKMPKSPLDCPQIKKSYRKSPEIDQLI